MLRQHLFKPIPITFLVAWRVLFGVVLMAECFGSILVGWTKQVFIAPPKFIFSFIGFEWIQPLSGSGMYIFFVAMGLLAIGVTLGYRYRLAMILFTVGWFWLYLMHKTSYNNHHYLMLLICLLMCVTPANRAFSLDVKRRPQSETSFVWALYKWQFILLLFIVFTYAAVAKIYPDWLNGVLIEHWFSYKSDLPFLTSIYTWKYTKYIVAWGGVLFDFLVIPALLYKPTRNSAFVIGVCFHLANSITFQIGTFPYMMIASAVFFYPDSVIRQFVKRIPKEDNNISSPSKFNSKWIMALFIFFFVIQLVLPLRHHLFKGHVVWNEEGHRLSWRMMLRSKGGNASFKVRLPDGEEFYHNAHDDLSNDQYHTMTGSPDMIWQYCQYLKKIYGQNIEIYITSSVSLNYRDPMPLIDPDYDMAKAKWSALTHSKWILPGPLD